MIDRELQEELFDSELALKAIWITGYIGRPRNFADEVDTWPEDVEKAIGAPAELLEDPDEFLVWCARKQKMGFLVEISAPLPTYHELERETRGGSMGIGGRYRVHYLYTEELNSDFIRQVLRWNEQLLDEEWAKQKKAFAKNKP